MATPRATRPAATEGVDGEMTFLVSKLSKPLKLKQKVRDPFYDGFRTWTMVIAIILTFYVLGEKMYDWGARSGQPTPAPVHEIVVPRPQPPVASTPAPAVQQPTTAHEPTLEELNQRYIEYLRNRDR